MKTKKLINRIRSGNKFSGRLFDNFFMSGQCLWDIIIKSEKYTHKWCEKKNIHICLEYTADISVLIFMVFVALPFMVVWATLKSI